MLIFTYKTSQIYSFSYIIRISIKNVTFMKHFSCIAWLGNFNFNSTTKAKDLVNFPSSLEVFALTASKDKGKQKQRHYHEYLSRKNVFVPQQSVMVFHVNKLYDNSFIRVPTVSGYW